MNYKEYLIKRNIGAMERIAIILLYVAAFFVMLCCFTFLNFLGGVQGIIAVGAFFLAYFLAGKLKKEFEYTFMDDSVDIDIIYNQSRRKKLISFSVKDVELIASMKDEAHNHRRKEDFDKVIDASSWRADVAVYFVILHHQGQKTAIKFEPPYSCLKLMKKYAPDKVFISDSDVVDNDFE